MPLAKLATIARDPTAPAEELARLSNYPELARDVAANPNTPIEALVRLSAEYPLEVVRNPAFTLALATSEVSPWHLKRDSLAKLIATREAPEALLTLASETSHPDVDRALLREPRTPAAGIERLRERNHPDAPYHVNAPAQELGDREELVTQAVADLKAFPQPTEPLMLALRPLLPGATARALAAAELPEARLYAATSEDLDEETLVAFTSSPNFEVAYGALRNPKTPAHALQTALESEQHGIVMAASVNPNLPRAALDELLRSADPTIAATALKNPQVTEEELRTALANASHVATLVSIGENTSAPPDLLEQLASHEEAVVRAAVARNPSTPAGVRDALARDNSHIVIAAAHYNPAQHAPIDLNDVDSILEAPPTCPEGDLVLAATLGRLPLDKVALFRVARRLTTSLSAAARVLLAANPATPAKLLEELRNEDADQRVRHAARLTLETAAC